MASRVLSLDLGTTAVKCAVVELGSDEPQRAELLAKHSVDTRAYVSNSRDPHVREQSVERILSAINEGVGFIAADLLRTCSGIAVTDQMHGVVLWDSRNPSRCCKLITWEDARADPTLLAGFNILLSEQAARLAARRGADHTAADGPAIDKRAVIASAPVFPGYGWVTLASLLKQRHPWVCGEGAFDCAGTLGTYITNVLAGCATASCCHGDEGGASSSSSVFMDPSDAASWGCYDVQSGGFDTGLLGVIGPELLRFVPRIVHSGSPLGRLSAEGARQLGLAATLAPMLSQQPSPPPASSALPAASAASAVGSAGSSEVRTSPRISGSTGVTSTSGITATSPKQLANAGSAAAAGLPPLSLGHSVHFSVTAPSATLASEPVAASSCIRSRAASSENASSSQHQSPLVHVSMGDHAAAMSAALAYAVRLTQAQLASQHSFRRHRLRNNSNSSLSSLPSDGGPAPLSSASSAHGSSLSLSGQHTDDEDDHAAAHHISSSHSSSSGAHHGIIGPDEDEDDLYGDGGAGEGHGLIPGMGRLTAVVVNVGTAAQVAAAGAGVVSLLESDAVGHMTFRLPPGCELRPLPKLRLDQGPPALAQQHQPPHLHTVTGVISATSSNTGPVHSHVPASKLAAVLSGSSDGASTPAAGVSGVAAGNDVSAVEPAGKSSSGIDTPLSPDVTTGTGGQFPPVTPALAVAGSPVIDRHGHYQNSDSTPLPADRSAGDISIASASLGSNALLKRLGLSSIEGYPSSASLAQYSEGGPSPTASPIAPANPSPTHYRHNSQHRHSGISSRPFHIGSSATDVDGAGANSAIDVAHSDSTLTSGPSGGTATGTATHLTVKRTGGLHQQHANSARASHDGVAQQSQNSHHHHQRDHHHHHSAGAAAVVAPATPLMLVAASTNGGNVLACIADRLTRWGSALADMQARARSSGPAGGAGGSGVSPLLGPSDRAQWSTRATYFYLESEAAKVFLDPSRYGAPPPSPPAGPAVGLTSSHAGADSCVAGVIVRPSLAPERVPIGYAYGSSSSDNTSMPSTNGNSSSGSGMTISGLTSDNSDSPGALYAAAAQAVIRNVCGLLPSRVWGAADIVIATGGGFYKSAVLRRCLNDFVAHVESSSGRARGDLQVVVMDEARAEFAGCIGAALTVVTAGAGAGTGAGARSAAVNAGTGDGSASAGIGGGALAAADATGPVRGVRPAPMEQCT